MDDNVIMVGRAICRNYDGQEGKCLADPEFGLCDLNCWIGREVAPKLVALGYLPRFFGLWLKDNNRYICSNCGFFYYASNCTYNYCPICGAENKR